MPISFTPHNKVELVGCFYDIDRSLRVEVARVNFVRRGFPARARGAEVATIASLALTNLARV